MVPADARGNSLMDIAEGAGLLDRFEAALKAASIDEMLAGEAPWTVFLPMNDAFARLAGNDE